jgi:gas vesicle protein
VNDDFEFIEKFATYMSMAFVDLETLAKNLDSDDLESALYTAWDLQDGGMPEVVTQWKEHMDKDGHYIGFRQTVIQQIQDEKDNIDLSKAALKFANWDPYHRAGYYNPDWDKVEQADAEELEALYKVWQEKFPIWYDDDGIQMNPNFGESSRLVGGADADLIVGTTLIDWKVINKPRTGLKENMAQLLGYAALAHLEGQTIEHVALYFGRHGQTVTVKIEDLTDIPLATIAASIKKLSLEASL